MGRSAHGVKGIGLRKDDELAGMVVVEPQESLLVITAKGYGKRVDFGGFTPHGRGTGGQIYIKVNEDTGEVSAVRGVGDDDEIFAITSQGMIIRTRVAEIAKQGKTARGVMVVRVKDPDFVVDIGRVEGEESAD
jgi:DNA gyrase subunit A